MLKSCNSICVVPSIKARQLSEIDLINCHWDNIHKKKVMYYPRSYYEHTIQDSISFMVILMVSQVKFPD